MSRKYKKCWKCKHVEIVYNYLVVAKESCPTGIKRDGHAYSDKATCEACENFEPKEAS